MLSSHINLLNDDDVSEMMLWKYTHTQTQTHMQNIQNKQLYKKNSCGTMHTYLLFIIIIIIKLKINWKKNNAEKWKGRRVWNAHKHTQMKI